MKGHGLSLVLLGVLITSGVWLGSLDFGSRLSTQVMDLLPSAERDPGVQLVRSLATTEHARTLLVTIEGLQAAPERQEAALAVAKTLRDSPLIAEVWTIDTPQLPEAALATWRDNAVVWFWPQWWEAHGRPNDSEVIAETAVEALTEFLNRPESSAWEDAVPADPFLLVPESIRQLEQALPLTSAIEENESARLWIRLAVSPFSEEGGAPLFALLSRARSELHREYPNAEMRDTSVSHFAKASESAIRSEITRLNVLVALSVAALCLVFLRRLGLFIPLLLILGATLIGGAVITLGIFSRVHVLTLVIGSILIGVAVDYGLHVFLESESTSRRSRLHAVARPLIVGGLSTIGGFLALTFTSLPVLQQMGTFIAGGLVAALATSLLFAERAPAAPESVRFLDNVNQQAGARPILITFLVLSPLLAGLFRIQWNDDIRELDYPLPAVRTNDAQVREAFGQGPAHRYLLLGSGWAAVEAEATRLQEQGEAEITSLTGWVSSRELAAAAHETARELELESVFREALESGDYDADAFQPFFDQWSRWTGETWSARRYELEVTAQLASLPGPAALLAGSDEQRHWWMLESDDPIEPPANVELVPLAQLDTLNHVFARYRREAMTAAGIGFGVLAVGLVLGFGIRAGAAVVALPVLPALIVLGFSGWRGEPLNLFHLLGTFLAVCLTVDYIVFALQARRRCVPLPPSIALSALTTAASFGWLATSAIPAVSALGSTVAPSVLLAWLLALGLTTAPSRSEPVTS